MKRLISLMLLLCIIAIPVYAFEELRYGVAVLGKLPEGSSADVESFTQLAEEITELIDYEFVSVDNIDGETLTISDLDGYKVLVIPSLEAIDKEISVVLHSFVNDGGKLFINADIKKEDLSMDFFNLAGFTLSDKSGNLIKFYPENGLFESEDPIEVSKSSVTIIPNKDGKTLASFVDADGKELSPAVILSDSGIVVADLFHKGISENDSLVEFIVESLYYLGDDRILSGFSPLGGDEWRPIVQATKNNVRRARASLRSAERQFQIIEPEILEAYEKAEKASDLMDTAFKNGNYLRITPYFSVADALAKEVVVLTQKVSNYEARAVWMDEQTIARAGNPDGLREVIRQVHEAGFNMILPEVVYHGKTLFPSEVGIQDTKYLNWSEDPFMVIVEEAKKYGIEVHAWTWVFCAGYSHNFGPILQKHPEWAEEDEEGRVFSNWQYGTAWLNASMPEPRQYLKDLFLEIVTKYHVDGLHLDYIRYNEDSVGHFGLSEYSRKAFEKEHGFDPKTVRVGSDEWKIFDQWREDNVTSFVREMSELVKAEKADLMISAAVVPDPSHSRNHVLQNWKNWADNKMLDFILTMAYTSNNSDLKNRTIAGLTVTENKVWVYPGLGVYVNTSENNMTQVQVTRDLGATGVAMFSTIHLLKESEKLEDLSRGVFREPAIIPHREPFLALKGLIEEAAETHSLAAKEDTAKALLALANTVPEKPENPIEFMEEMATSLSKHIDALQEQKDNRELTIIEHETLSGSLMAAWRITQIYIYQNTDRPYIQPEPRQ